MVTGKQRLVASLYGYMRARSVWLVGAALVLVLGVHLAFLTHYPPVFIDEPWYANAAWNWLKTGVSFDTMHAGALNQTGYEYFRWPFLGHLPWVLSFAALGLGLFQARLVSWCLGTLLVVGTVLVGRRAYSTMSGAVAALLLVLSAPFSKASHYARPEVLLVTVLMAVYGLAILSFERKRWWAHLVTGLLLGLALDIHPNAAMFMPALAGLYLITYRSQVLRRRGTWLCAAGGLMGIGYYGLTHIAPNPSAYFSLLNLSVSGSHGLPLLAAFNPLHLAQSLLQEMRRYHPLENSLDLTLIAAGLGYAVMRRSRSDLRLLFFIAMAFACFTLFVGNKHDIYAILFYPFFMLLAAEGLVGLFREAKAWRSPVQGLAAMLTLFVLVSGAVRLVRPFVQNQDYDYYGMTGRMRSVIPAGARVMGLPVWWLGLADCDYRSSLNLTYYHLYNGYSLTEGLEAERPDYIIVDSALRQVLVEEGYFPAGPGFEIYKLPGREFDGFLTRQGHKVLQFSNRWHGKFEVYAIRWD